jgi:thiol:disulfide interchange protein
LLLPAAGSIAVFAALGLGLALPFVLFAFVPGLVRWLPKPGPWMARLQRWLAIPMAATVVACLWLLWRQGGLGALAVGTTAIVALAILLVWAGWCQRKGAGHPWVTLAVALAVVGGAVLLTPRPISATTEAPRGAERWSEQKVDRYRARGVPMFVYFTADWCLSCKVNEAAAIDREETRNGFKSAGVKVLVGDWTNGDPAITRFLESRGRAAVPLYLWYAPGTAAPEELPQLLRPSMLSARARALPKR